MGFDFPTSFDYLNERSKEVYEYIRPFLNGLTPAEAKEVLHALLSAIDKESVIS